MVSLRILPYLLILVAVFVTFAPIAYLLFGSLWSTSPGMPGSLTLSNYAQMLADPTTSSVVITSLAYSVMASLLATTGGFLVAFLVHRTDAPLRRLMTVVILVTLAVPFFVEDLSWSYLLNPSNGLFNVWFRTLTGAGFPLINVYSIWGLAIVMGIDLIPLSYLTIAASLSLMDPILEESSRVSGARLRTTLRRIVVPLMRPAILSTFLLDFIISMEAFDAPAILGVPGGVYVLTTSIYRSIVAEIPPNYGVASSYAVILIATTLVALALYLMSTRQSDRFVTLGARPGRPSLISLGRTRWLAGAFFIAYISLYPVPILATIFLASTHLFWNPGFLLTGFTLQNFSDFISFSTTQSSILNSFAVAISASAIAVLLAFSVGYSRSRAFVPGARFAEAVVTIPLALPTLVLGLGLLWTLVLFPLPIFGTIWALTLAYVVRYIPVVIRLLSAPLSQVKKDFEEIARICGASQIRTIRSVVLPLLKPAIVISLIYVFLVSMKDLGAAVILVTQSSRVLQAVIFEFWSAGRVSVASAAGALYILVLGVILAIAVLIFRANPTSLVSPEGERVSVASLREEKSALS